MNNYKLDDISENLILFILDLKKNLFETDEMFKGLDIPPSHAKVVCYLSKMGPSSISQIAKDLMISKPNMTPIIDKLINLNLVHRYYDVNDRRIIRVETTEKAKNIFNAHKEYMKIKISNKLSNLSNEDIGTINECLEKMHNIFENMTK